MSIVDAMKAMRRGIEIDFRLPNQREKEVSGDACAVKTLDGIVVQENGLIRNSRGRLIAKLFDDINFASEHLAIDMRKFNSIIDTCEQGHIFAKLENHPKDKHGSPRCPNCMSIGLDKARQELADLKDDLEQQGMDKNLRD